VKLAKYAELMYKYGTLVTPAGLRQAPDNRILRIVNLEELEKKALQKKQLVLGALFMCAVGLAFVFAYWMGALRLGGSQKIYIEYNFAGGIDRGSPIRLGGIKVGRITGLSFEGSPAKVLLEAQIDNRAFNQITEDSKFYVNLAGLIGERYIEIVPGEAATAKPGSKIIGVDPPRVDQLFSQSYGIFGDLRDFFGDNKNDIKDILGSLNALSTNLNRLVSSTSPKEREQIKTLIENFSAMSTDLRYTVSKLRSGVDSGVSSGVMNHLSSIAKKADSIDRNDIRRLMLEDGMKVNFSTKKVPHLGQNEGQDDAK
jgi:phospholipid/cholesterol/gamma-HCH transport system substrate-binding protein